MLLLAQPSIADDHYPKLSWDDIPVQEIIKCIAPAYGQDPVLISNVIKRESTYNPNAVHDGGRGKGVTGFHTDTFNRWNKQYLKETGEVIIYDSTLDQIKLMSWAFSKGESYRDDWTSYNKIKKTS